MRPGKPLMFGRRDGTAYLGLPGNPVSALVCARIFLVPLIAAMLALDWQDDERTATLGAEVPANAERQEYQRASVHVSERGAVIYPEARQDSSMLALLGRSNALLIRPPHAPAAKAGETCRYLPLEPRLFW